MTNQFGVIEYRGCEMEHLVFDGSLKECREWMDRNTCDHPQNYYVRVHNEMYVNENNELLSYYISELDM